MAKAKISSKYQITLPKEVRDELGVGAGDDLFIVKEGDKVVLKPLLKVKEPTKFLYGSVKSKEDAVEIIRELRKSGRSY